LNHAVLNPAQSADEIENLQYYLLVQEIIATSTSLPSIFAEYKTDSCPMILFLLIIEFEQNPLLPHIHINWLNFIYI
jgi:hypothetical protein